LNHELLERVYNGYAKRYDRIFGRVFQDGRERALAGLNPRPSDRVLEVGVGTGLCLPLYPPFVRVTGIDFSHGMLAKAGERVAELGLKNVELAQMDVGAMTFPDSSFDIVFAAYVLPAVPDHRKAMDEMVRVCRPGGRIVFLNHLVNGAGVLAFLERLVSPLCARLGFRTDLTLDEVMRDRPLEVRSVQKVKPFDMWFLVECVNRKGDGVRVKPLELPSRAAP
jgi:phosphatidylethanolamine/phosphatidyl-N-methylethanolamine N-methyltransferase